MQYLKTEKCIVCGGTATVWHGHVVAADRMASGNCVDRCVIAGFCKRHDKVLQSKADGCYGRYNSKLMGKCIPIFSS